MKAEAAETVMAAIRCVLSGRVYISAKITDQILHRARTGHKDSQSSNDPVERLTDRELQLFSLLGEGVKVRQIAKTLYISVKTVESHRVNIKRKLSLNTSDELLRYAIQYMRARLAETARHRSSDLPIDQAPDSLQIAPADL